MAVLLRPLPLGLEDLVGSEAPHQHAVVVPGGPDVDVGGGEVRPVLLQHGLVPDGVVGTVQQRETAVVPTDKHVSLSPVSCQLSARDI